MRLEYGCKILLGVSCTVIVVLSIVPDGNSIASTKILTIGWDKLLHFISFTVLLLLALGSGLMRGRGGKWPVVLLLFLYGGGIEGIQHFISYRTFNPVDILFNAGGIVFGLILWGVLPGVAPSTRSTESNS